MEQGFTITVTNTFNCHVTIAFILNKRSLSNNKKNDPTIVKKFFTAMAKFNFAVFITY